MKQINKKIIINAVIASFLIVVGAVSGVVIKKLTGTPEIIYDGFDVNMITPNISSIMNKYENYEGNNYQKDFMPSELVNIALEKYRNYDNSYSIAKGDSKSLSVSQDQYIRNYQIRNGDTYFEESLSSSAPGATMKVSIGQRNFQNNGEIKVYDATSSSVEEANWDENKYVTYNPISSFKEKYGKTLDEMFIYIISSKTVSSSEIRRDDNDNYVIYLELDPLLSVYNYVTQMKNISNLDYLPQFNYVHLTYTLSRDIDLISLHVEEEYHATKTEFGIQVSVGLKAVLDTKYYPNQYLAIPDFTTDLDYSLFDK